jgi:hypothetical protein
VKRISSKVVHASLVAGVFTGVIFPVETKSQSISITADVFNLFNLRAVVRRGQNYTLRPVEPITTDPKGARVSSSRIDPSKIQAADGEERPFDDTDRNRSFGSPLEYQAPLTLRLGIKSTF